MKNILIILLLFISGGVFSQSTPPVNQSFGSPTSATLFKGVPVTDSGYWWRFSFTDTIAPNLGLLKNCKGIIIRVGDTLYMRSNDLSHWVKQGASGGTVSQTLQQVYDVQNRKAILTSTDTTQLLTNVHRWLDAGGGHQVRLNFLALGTSNTDAPLTVDVQNLAGTIIKAIGKDPGFVKFQVDNTVTPAEAVALGIPYATTLSGLTARNTNPGNTAIMQVGVGVGGSFFADSCAFLFGVNGNGLKIATSATGDIRFVTGSTNEGAGITSRFKNNGHFLINNNTDIGGKWLNVNGATYLSDSLLTPNFVRATDTAGFDIDIIDRSTGNHKKIYPNVLGALISPTPNLQAVITAGATLTLNDTINYANQILLFSGVNVFQQFDDPGGDLNFVVSDDFSITSPDVILVTAPTLQTDTTNNKYLGRNSGGEVVLMPAPSFTTPIWQQTLIAGSTLSQDNTVANGANTLEITNNTLAGDYGVRISSTSTAAAAGSQILFNVDLSGANASASEATVAAQITNTHTGSGTNIGFVSSVSGNTTNIGGSFAAVGGTNSYALIVPSGSGNVGFGTSTPSSVAKLHVVAAAGAFAIEGVSGSGGVGIYGESSNSFGIQGIHTTSGGVGVQGQATAAVTTNTAAQFIAQNGLTNNIAISVPVSSGNVGFGIAIPTAGILHIVSPTTTGTTSTSGIVIASNSLTTGTSQYHSSSTISSGKMIDIAITGTAGLTNQTGINVSLSGANGTGAQTTYGAIFSNTHTGTSVNVGAEFIASGGSTNTAIRVASGNGRVAIGQLNANAALDVVGTAILDAIATSSNAGNSSFFVSSATGFSGSATAQVQLLGSSTVDFRTLENGSTATTGATGRPYFTHIIGASAYTEPGSGTVPAIGSLALRAPTITAGAGAVTNGVTFYIENAPSPAGATNYAMWIDDGVARLDGGILGTATNDNATAGNTGEYVSSLIASGSAVSLTTATAANVTSISLTAGDWDVTGTVSFTETTATVSARSAGLSSTSATIPTDGSEAFCGVQSTVTSETNSIALVRKRFSLSATTTIYLVGSATFSAGTCAGFGNITARRIR